jgi:hypothetical protein
VGFEQAAIEVEKKKEFEELKDSINRAFAADRVEKFLKRLHSDGTRIRNWDSVLNNGVLERVDEGLKSSGTRAQSLYESLPVSDQAQMREFYLSKIEEVAPQMRARFHKLYQYY